MYNNDYVVLLYVPSYGLQCLRNSTLCILKDLTEICKTAHLSQTVIH